MTVNRPSRRQVLQASGAAGLASLLGPSPAAAASLPQAPLSKPLALPAWRYGADSAAPDTSLMFRGNPSHTFYGTGPIKDAPELQWRLKTASFTSRLGTTWSGTGWSGTAIKLGDYVFVGSVGAALYAIEAKSGKVAWVYDKGAMYKSSVCAWQNRLYIGNVDDHLRCFDAATGRILWKVNTGTDLDSSPCVANGKLYIAGENGYTRCLDPLTGEQIWKTFTGGIGGDTKPGSNGSETSPAVHDGRVYVANYFGELWCLDAETGAELWRADTGDDTDASIVVAGDYIYAGAEEKSPHLYCFDRLTGQRIWRYDGNRTAYYSTPAVVGDRLWVGGADSRLHCVNALTGEALWTFKTGAPVWSSPAVVDNRVIFGSRDFNLYMLDATTGEEIWRYKTDGRIISSPLVVDGGIWIGCATGYFYHFA
jgi:outer membrane protein assembly factor BamB